MGYLDKKTVDDLNVAGKKVLVRCDFNVLMKTALWRLCRPSRN